MLYTAGRAKLVLKQNIPLEIKCVRQDLSVGGIGMNPMRYPIFNITAYAWVLSDTFYLQWDTVYII